MTLYYTYSLQYWSCSFLLLRLFNWVLQIENSILSVFECNKNNTMKLRFNKHDVFIYKLHTAGRICVSVFVNKKWWWLIVPVATTPWKYVCPHYLSCSPSQAQRWSCSHHVWYVFLFDGGRIPPGCPTPLLTKPSTPNNHSANNYYKWYVRVLCEAAALTPVDLWRKTLQIHEAMHTSFYFCCNHI